MHHVVLDRWSQGSSLLHARDPRVKTLAVLGFLVAVATTTPITAAAAVGYLGIIIAGTLVARVPFAGLLRRACVVLPFSGTFALFVFLAGDPQRAVEVLLKSYVSALAVLLLVSTTPLPCLLGGIQRMGAPPSIVFVIQLVYRYLFVISEQAQHMLQAARCRGSRSHWRAGVPPRNVDGNDQDDLSPTFFILRVWRTSAVAVRAAVRMLAVLFGKSYERAEAVHRAMLARGFEQRLVLLRQFSLNAGDAVFLFAAASAITMVRLVWNPLP